MNKIIKSEEIYQDQARIYQEFIDRVTRNFIEQAIWKSFNHTDEYYCTWDDEKHVDIESKELINKISFDILNKAYPILNNTQLPEDVSAIEDAYELGKLGGYLWLVMHEEPHYIGSLISDYGKSNASKLIELLQTYPKIVMTKTYPTKEIKFHLLKGL